MKRALVTERVVFDNGGASKKGVGMLNVNHKNDTLVPKNISTKIGFLALGKYLSARKVTRLAPKTAISEVMNPFQPI